MFRITNASFTKQHLRSISLCPATNKATQLCFEKGAALVNQHLGVRLAAGGDRIGMMKFEKPRRHFQISFIPLLLPRFSLCQNVQYNLI